MDEADLFFRDYNTIKDARKRLQNDNENSRYYSYIFDRDLVKNINELVEDKFGEGTKLL